MAERGLSGCEMFALPLVTGTASASGRGPDGPDRHDPGASFRPVVDVSGDVCGRGTYVRGAHEHLRHGSTAGTHALEPEFQNGKTVSDTKLLLLASNVSVTVLQLT